MFYETITSSEPFLPLAVETQKYAPVVITKTLHLTTTKTVSLILSSVTTVTATPAATVTPVIGSPPYLTFEVPHYPKIDTAFTVLFGVICLVLIIGLICRKKSKKLKAFNIPLILGTFCKPILLPSNSSQCIRTLSPC
jgi:amino acid transporter